MKYFALIILMVSTTVSANIPSKIPLGKWQCLAFDEKHYSYSGVGANTREAMHAAKKLCRNKSKSRLTCETAQSFCEQGPLSLIDDRCIVRDTNGRTWNATGINSCKTARKLCSQWQFLHGKTNQCSVAHR